MILLMAGILRLIFSSLGFITGIVAGLRCARFSRDVSPGWAVAIGLIVGSVVGLGCCTSWGFEIFDISMIQYILIVGSVSAVLTAVICLCGNKIENVRRRTGAGPSNDIRRW